jgi:hypothetical protein
MADFFFRTEDIPPPKIAEFYAETQKDRAVIDELKNRTPSVLVGSRGVGKSFLLRVAQQELLADFKRDRVFPIYVSFQRSSLVRGGDKNRFQNWMLARLCSSLVRALEKEGLLATLPRGISLIAGQSITPTIEITRIEQIADAYEESYKNPELKVEDSSIPSIEAFTEAIEDLAEGLGIKRFVFLIDEAAHIFLPEQQRQFFTLFRDLRSHCLVCNAAVYPGVTAFGDTFQPSHDATMLEIDRDPLDDGYVAHMREIVQKQADSSTQRSIVQRGENFAILAYAASGNPRLLLKTLADAPGVSSSEINQTIRKFYRSNIWAEHTDLGERYIGHKSVIDWGRKFVEDLVLPEIKSKNDNYIESEKNTSCFLWIHKNAPEGVKEALRILLYTGVLRTPESGIKATRAEVGKRYAVNLGCLFALESTPASTAFQIAKNLTPKRMTEYGARHPAFNSIIDLDRSILENDEGFDLGPQFEKPISVLDLTNWQMLKLQELGLNTVGEVLQASEADLMTGYYVGEVRARIMKNAAYAAVLEYLSG